MPERLAHEMTVAYGERLRFEAQIIASAVWGRGRQQEAGDVDGASDDELGEFMAIA